MKLFSVPLRLVQEQLQLFATALTFLTRLPWVARFALAEPEALARSARYWPGVGTLIAAPAAALMLLAMPLGAAIAAWLALGCTMLLTGGFHEDGLADSADGFYGGYTPQKRLEIMKDSRIGSFGALALIVVIALKAAALQRLLEFDANVAAAALLCAHSWARFSSLVMVRWLPYVSEGAVNKPVAQNIGWRTVLIGLGYCCALLVGIAALEIVDPHRLAAILLVLPGLWLLCGLHARQKIAGICGDVLGAINQLTELCVLLLFCLMR